MEDNYMREKNSKKYNNKPLTGKEAILRLKADEFIKSGKRFNGFRVFANIEDALNRKVGMLAVIAWSDDEGKSVRFAPISFNINDTELGKIWEDCIHKSVDKVAGKDVSFDTFFTANSVNDVYDKLDGDIINTIKDEKMIYLL